MKTTRTMEQTKRIILWLPERTIFYGDIVCEGKELDVYIEEGCKVTGDFTEVSTKIASLDKVCLGKNVIIPIEALPQLSDDKTK